MKKEDFNIAIKIYKWISIISFILYPVYIIFDDFVLLEKASLLHLPLLLLLEILWFGIYFLGFSLYYWLIAIVVIFVVLKMKKRSVKP